VNRAPIRVRVAAAFAVTMAVVLVLAGGILYFRLGQHLDFSIDKQLQVRAQDLAVLVEEPGANIGETGGVRFFEQGESYAQLIDASGRVREASPSLEGAGSLLTSDELQRALEAPGDEGIFSNRGSVPGLDEPSRILAIWVMHEGERLVLLVGQTREERAETLRSLRNELLVAGPLALVLATLSGYLLAGIALRPVDSMRRRAASISAETPGERLPVPMTGDEIERLGETLNEMLARLEAALQREREFVSDAGHELRTPLALLRTELELALRHANSAAELREAVRASSEEVDRLAQLAEDLLLIARSDEGRLALRTETLDGGELLDSVARRFEWRAQEAGRRVSAEEVPGLELVGDRIRLEQALGNLVENALRYGAGDVGLSASTENGVVELHVTDEGAGFPPEFLERAFERFTRPDVARTRGGTGLGLSIVRVIAEAHGGVAMAANRASGGADVWVALPAGTPPGTRDRPVESSIR
jgi:two-component system, OmpR family, sensor kinase